MTPARRIDPESGPGRMPCLDGLRGVAAAIVVLGHAHEFGFPTVIAEHARDYGVLVFFVLSGFLMGTLYLRRPIDGSAAWEYIASRIARIVPIYYSVIAASFIYYKIDNNFVYNISNYQFIKLTLFTGSISVFWSIGPEFQFYFIFLFIWKIKSQLRNYWFFSLFILISSFMCIYFIDKIPGILVFSKFHIFACGMMCALLRQHAPAPSRTVIAAAQSISVGLLLLVSFSDAFSTILGQDAHNRIADPAYSVFYGSAPRVLMAGFVVLSLSYRSPWGMAIFANRATALLGASSFSIYLLHEPVFYFYARSALMPMFPIWAGLPLALAALVIVAWISFRMVETPLRTHMKRLVLSIRPRGGCAASFQRH
jgi:peptidoglycan/LPS O-acetylase OafA/YrhL